MYTQNGNDVHMCILPHCAIHLLSLWPAHILANTQWHNYEVPSLVGPLASPIKTGLRDLRPGTSLSARLEPGDGCISADLEVSIAQCTQRCE